MFEKKEKKASIQVQVEKIEDQKSKSKQDINDFINSCVFLFDEKGFENGKIKKDKKEYGYNDLDESKKSLFRFMAINKSRKKLDIFLLENKIKLADDENLKQFSKKLDEEVDKIKNILYKTHGAALHPLDKDFLESMK